MENLIIQSCNGTITTPTTLTLAFLAHFVYRQCQLINSRTREIYPEDYSFFLSSGDDFDFIVVGAGSAGSVVASRLSENCNVRVLLIEAGGLPSVFSEIPKYFFLTQQTEEDWQYKTQKSPNFCKGLTGGVCNWPRGKVLGGCSAINAMMYLRGNRRDYDTWASMGNAGWDYDSIKKYFLKFENVTDPILMSKPDYGKGGLLTISRGNPQQKFKKILIEAAREMELAYNDSEQPLGYYTAPSNIENGQRCSSSKAFLTKIPRRSNLYIARHSNVRKILINRNGDAFGVEVITPFGKRNIFAKKEVILSAGTINTPQILMNSGIGPSHHLKTLGIPIKKDLPVGENLQDHIISFHFMITIPEYLIEKRDTKTEALDYFLNREGMLASIGITNFVGTINTKNDSEYHDIQLLHFLYSKNNTAGLESLGKFLGFTRLTTESEIEVLKKSAILRLAPTLIKPKSRGRIVLDPKDPFGKPLIYAGYFSDPGNEDIETLKAAMRYAKAFAETRVMKGINSKIVRVYVPGCDANFPDDEYYECIIRSTATTLYHPVGTCKMAPLGDSSGVVDPRLKVHGIGRLRVVDASVMPVIVGINTNGPTMMIGEKGADMIKEDWGM